MADIFFNPFDATPCAHSLVHTSSSRHTGPIHESASGVLYISRDVDVREVLQNTSIYSREGSFALVRSDDPSVMLQIDPARYRQIRSLLHKALPTRVFQGMMPFIMQATTQLIHKLALQKQADLMESIAIPLPLMAFSHLLGVPEEDDADFRFWMTEMSAIPPHKLRGRNSWHNFCAYIHHMIDERSGLKYPPNDLVTRLMYTQIEGMQFTDDEIQMVIFHLVTAGSSLTTALIGNLLYELLRVPERWQRVNDNRELVEHAIEESLRYSTPIGWVVRKCARETTLGGVKIAQGMRLVLGLAAANRDEVVWTNPHEFTFGRPNGNRHLAFGHGFHLCLGAELARMQARIVLKMLLTYFPCLHLVPGFHYEAIGGAMPRGPKYLHAMM